MINENILSLIEEIEKFSTLERMFKYGPIKTLALAFNRLLNNEVYKYLEKFLITLDEAIEYANNNKYKVNVNRVDIGELYNSTTIDTENASDFFIKYFNSINLFVKELCKATINEMNDSNVDLSKITSLSNFANLNHSSELYFRTSLVVNEYLDLLKNKPTFWMSLLSELKRFRVDSNIISNTIISLEKDVIAYAKLKNSVAIHKY